MGGSGGSHLSLSCLRAVELNLPSPQSLVEGPPGGQKCPAFCSGEQNAAEALDSGRGGRGC